MADLHVGVSVTIVLSKRFFDRLQEYFRKTSEFWRLIWLQTMLFLLKLFRKQYLVIYQQDWYHFLYVPQ